MKRKIIKRFVLIAAVSLVIFCAALFALFISVKNGVDAEVDAMLFKKASKGGSTVFLAYDEKNTVKKVCSIDSDGKRDWCFLNDVGDNLIAGFISMEDRDFYLHNGVNVKRTLSALLNYVSPFGSKFGASTITQQVIKNISGDNERTLFRKAKEIYRACLLEKNFSKDEILQMYLNIVPMSGNIYGVKRACEAYFNKEPDELDLAEAATIVGITNSPARYDPYAHKDACLEKRNKVLYAMLDNGYIDEIQYETEIKKPLAVREKINEEITDWFVETARAEVVRDLSQKYGISKKAAGLMLRGGKVVMTVNCEMQRILEEFFENESNFPKEVDEGLNYGFALFDNDSGNLIAVVGGALEKKGDLVLNFATRNIVPGSTLKPLALYAPLIEEGRINAATVFDDAPSFSYEKEGKTVYYPKNSPDKYFGLITVKDALRLSKNTVAVRLLDLLGKERAFDMLKQRYGFDLVKEERGNNGKAYTDMDTAPLALGQLTHGITLIDLTRAYTAFARDGMIGEGKSYYGVFDSDGNILLQNEERQRRIYSEQTSRIMTQLLANVVDDGTAWNVSLKEIVDTAGKTGTSGGDKDRLFVGFTPYYTAGVWCGYSGEKWEIGQLWPSHINIWDSAMKLVHNERLSCEGDGEIKNFSVVGLEYLPYCKDSGLICTDKCEFDLRGSRVAYAYFSSDNRPDKECDRHKLFLFNTENGRLYGYSEKDFILDESFVVISLVDFKREEHSDLKILDGEYLIPQNDFVEDSLGAFLNDIPVKKKKGY